MTAENTAPAPTQVIRRVRMIYTRGEALRYVSHLDFQLVWERTFRRARLPLAFSQGFNPRPRMHLASALPLGFLSRCEIVDVWVVDESGAASAGEFAQRVAELAQRAAPPGLAITRAEDVPLSEPALQTRVSAAEYFALPLDPLDLSEVQAKAQELLSAETLPRERRGKAYDLRPLIHAFEARELNGCAGFFMRLSARESATGRPEEALSALGFDPAAFRVERTNLLLES